MKRLKGLVAVSVALAGLLVVGVAQAQVSNVFNMPNGEASLQFVTVGNPNNPPDTVQQEYPVTRYLGSVPYVYRIGKYDVTIGQYVQFLNAVAATDTYGLYNSGMATGYPTVGIVQSGSAGSYTYSVSYNASDWNSYVAYNSSLYPSALAAANDAPVFDVTWGDAARFCNWLQNGQPTNLGEAANSTETGAYTLNGDTTNLMTETRNTGVATYFIPTENEWYKAAYFNPSNSTYWAYEIASNTVPSNVLSVTGTNNANSCAGSYPNDTHTDPTNYLTPVGAFAASPGPYGTFDMGGDLYQWNEANILGYFRGLRGGSWANPSTYLASSYCYCYDDPWYVDSGVGFRVASVPEPATIALLLASAACLLGYAWRRRLVA